MLGIAPTQEFLDEAERLAKKAEGRRVAVQCADNATRARLLAQLSTHKSDWIVVRSRSSLDQSERVLLDVATALGDGVLAEIDAQLQAEPDEPAGALATLSTHINGRRLLIDGLDELRTRGPDPELGRTLENRRSAVAHWLTEHGGLIVSTRTPPELRALMELFDVTNDVSLRDSAPFPFAADSDRGLQLAAHLLGDHEASEGLSSSDELRTQIDSLLPRSAQRLLRTLAVHNRPLSRPAAEHLTDERALDSAVRLGLVHETSAGLITDGGWTTWVHHGLERQVRQRLHLDLARWFARANADEARPGGLNVLEAHRHFVSAGEFDKAQRFVRYSAALLIDEARRLSRSGRYERAGHVYEAVLSGAARQGWPLGPKLRGYATHYLHFNRARDDREPLEDTESGYQRALEDWPGNALFWSRLIRTQCYLGRRAAALTTLGQAKDKVSSHPLKSTFLIGRTVRGLLRRARDEEKSERIIDALLIWGDYVPDSEMSKEVGADLRQQLGSGWKSRCLAVGDDARPLVFNRELLVRIESLSSDWLASIPELETRGRGQTPLSALGELVHAIRGEAHQMLHAYTHRLDATARLRKRRLLGALEVRASGIDAEPEKSTWTFGDIEEHEGMLWLRTGGNLDLRFEIPASFDRSSLRRDRPYFARVATGPSGMPEGPVQELELGFGRSDEEVWQEWRLRLVDE